MVNIVSGTTLVSCLYICFFVLHVVVLGAMLRLFGAEQIGRNE